MCSPFEPDWIERLEAARPLDIRRELARGRLYEPRLGRVVGEVQELGPRGDNPDRALLVVETPFPWPGVAQHRHARDRGLGAGLAGGAQARRARRRDRSHFGDHRWRRRCRRAPTPCSTANSTASRADKNGELPQLGAR